MTYHPVKRSALPLRHPLQRIRYLDILLRQSLASPGPFAILPRLRGLEPALTQGRPRGDGHALIATHGDDLALHVADSRVPLALVDGERTQAVGARVVVGLDDDPRRRVRHPEVEHLAGGDERVQAVHDLLDGGGKVPPVHVQQVDVVGAQLLQAAVDGDVHALDRVADKVGLDGLLVAAGGAIAGRILGRDADAVCQFVIAR